MKPRIYSLPGGLQRRVDGLITRINNAERAPMTFTANQISTAAPKKQPIKAGPTPIVVISTLIPWKATGGYWAYYIPDEWTVGVATFSFGNVPISISQTGNHWITQVAISGQFDRSDDRGATANILSFPLGTDEALAGFLDLVFDNNDRLWCLTFDDGGVFFWYLYYSDDFGETWSLQYTGDLDIIDNVVYMLRVDPTGQYITVTAQDDTTLAGVVHAPTDGGTTFSRTIIEAFATLETSMGCVWSGTNFIVLVYASGTFAAQFYKSPDGITWTLADSVASARGFFNNPVTSPVVLDNGTVIYEAFLDGVSGMYRSADGGDTWEFIPYIGSASNGDIIGSGDDLYILDGDGSHFWKVVDAKTSDGTVIALADIP